MAGLIPQLAIDELLSRCDIIELIDSYVPLKKLGRNYVSCCPFHQEKTPSFNVIAKKQFFHCFGCGKSGNAISFIMQYLNQGFLEAVDTLALRVGLKIPPRESHKEKLALTISLYEVLDQSTAFYQQQLQHNGKAAITYLKARGIDAVIAQQYQLGYAPSGWNCLKQALPALQAELLTTGMLIKRNESQSLYDRYRNRIMFPIHDTQGRIIGFGGRALTAEQKPKYINSPETIIFQKKRELYGLYHALQHNRNPKQIIIVEGYLDVLALSQHQITNAVAALGTAISTQHIQSLLNYTQQIIFCFDGDQAGKTAAWRALEICLPYMNSSIDAKFILLPNQHDPDSFIRTQGIAAFQTLLTQAIPLHQFLLDTLIQNINTQELNGKTNILNLLTPYLQMTPEGAFKELLLHEITKIVHIDASRINQITTAAATVPQDSHAIVFERSPIRIALALLLQNPELYSCGAQFIDTLESQDTDFQLLRQLAVHIRDIHHPTTAQLIEAWRSQPLFGIVTQLATWDHQVPEEAMQHEFIDILSFLNKQITEKRISTYMQKSKKEGLTIPERTLLTALLKNRHISINEPT